MKPNSRKTKKKFFHWIVLLLLTFMLFSAATLFAVKNAGKLLVSFVEDQAVPYVLKTDDVAMGCMMAESLTLLIPSLVQINASPYKLAILFDFLSGSCAEFKAWEEELRYLRAIHNKNTVEAQDARILQKRYLNRAARRQLKGYLNFKKAYLELSGDNCPVLDSWNEEFYWMIGLMDGLQAVMNDLASGGEANVPLDISLKVGRGARCLNNEKWWGMPVAIQAAIWINFPSYQPDGINPLQVLDSAVNTGLKQGMRIAQVVAAKIHIGRGDAESVKQIIRDNIQTRLNIATHPDFIFLDEVASIQLQAISDHMWTDATGKRTPIGAMGTFWDDPKNTVDTIDLIDIL